MGTWSKMVGQDLEGVGRGSFHGTILAFAWTKENREISQPA